MYENTFIMLNMFCFTIMLLIFCYTFADVKKHNVADLYFRNFLFVCMTYFLSSSCRCYFQFRIKEFSLTPLWIANTLVYGMTGALGLFWVMSSVAYRKVSYGQKPWFKVIMYGMATVSMGIAGSSYWTHFVFNLDENGNRINGPLRPLYIILISLPPVVSSVRAYIDYLTKKTHEDRYLSHIFGFFLIPPTIATIVQLLTPGIDLYALGLTVDALCFCIIYREKLVTRDALTGINNRFRMQVYLEKLFMHHQEDEEIYAVMMDIDNFKKINDLRGHIEGDEALRTVGRVLKDTSAGRSSFIARYGGDEFILIVKNHNIDDINEYIEDINTELIKACRDKHYSIHLSSGIAKLSDEYKTPQEFIAAADKELYIVKAARKGGIANV